MHANEKQINRETWLAAAAELLRPTFESVGYPIETPFRVSCGFPSNNVRKAIGQAWAPKMSSDGHGEMFISPVLSDPKRVLDVLAHEMVHLAVGVDKGHKAPFAKCAKAIGLTGKMTATVGTEEFYRDVAAPIITALGGYPHARLNLSNRQKQTTRLVKCECSSCGYVARTTRKWIDDLGAPLCPCNGEPMKNG